MPHPAIRPARRARPRLARPAFRLTLVARLALGVGLAGALWWQWLERSVAEFHRVDLVVSLSAPRWATAPGAGAPALPVRVHTSSIAGGAVPCSLRWVGSTADGTECARGELDTRGEAVFLVPAGADPVRTVEVVGERNGGTRSARLELAPPAAPPLLHVGTDRPAYRPGDTVLLRAVLLDRLALTPLAAPRELWARVLDGEGRLRHEAAVAPLPGDGSVATAAWPIPKDLPGGTYEIQVNDAEGGVPVEQVQLLVRDDQPPRLRTTLTLDRTSYSPGATGGVEVQVERMGGGAAEAASVAATLVVDGREVWRDAKDTDARGRAVFAFAVPAQVEHGVARLAACVSDGGVVETEVKPFVVPTGVVRAEFAPEGGALVAGLATRLHVQLRDTLGRPVHGRGAVRDDRGVEVCGFVTQDQGRGRCGFTPAGGRRYELALTEPAVQVLALPAVARSGVVLRALRDVVAPGAALEFDVRSAPAQRLLIGAFCRGVLVGSAMTSGSGGRVAIAVPAQVAGVLRVTAFAADLEPWAERLVRRLPARRMDVALEPVHTTLLPGGSQGVRVRTRDERGQPVAGVVGLSVTDLAVEDLGVAPRIGIVDHASLFADACVSLDHDSRRLLAGADAAVACDLLLGCQAWRRNAWRATDPVEDPRRVDAREREAPAPEAVADSGAGALANAMFARARDATWRAKALTVLCLVVVTAWCLAELAAAALRLVRGRLLGRPVPWWQQAVAGLVGIVPVVWVVAAESSVPLCTMKAAAPTQRTWLDLRLLSSPPSERFTDPAPAPRAPRPVAPGPRALRHQHAAADLRRDFAETVCWEPLLVTDARGEASVTFDLGDRVTTWLVHADAHGAGRLGQAEATFVTRQPLLLEARLPAEVSEGDLLQVPVAVTAESATQAEVLVTARGPLAVEGPVRQVVTLAGGRGTVVVPVRVLAGAGEAALELSGHAGRASDRVQQTVRVVPRGHPLVRSAGGLAAPEETVTLRVPDHAVPGSARVTLRVFPSVLVELAAGMDGLLQEPHGCFEQASSTNYPNVLALAYLAHTGRQAPALAAHSRALLSEGYRLLTSYECAGGGFEWFGKAPAHLALTAYGLWEFTDMAQVFAVDPALLARTRAWLLAQRDGSGGFRGAPAQYGFGGASADTTAAYVTLALLAAGESPEALAVELARLAQRVQASRDPYELALCACALGRAARPESAVARQRLAVLQAPDGGIAGTAPGIAGSRGRDLAVETTGFAVLAWHGDAAQRGRVAAAVQFLARSRRSNGTFGATQATVVALQALLGEAIDGGAPAAGTLTAWVDGQRALRSAWSERDPALAFDLPAATSVGEHAVRVAVDQDGGSLPFACELQCRVAQPEDDPGCPVELTTTLAAAEVGHGGTVELCATVRNRGTAQLAMTLASLGLPAGLEAPTAVLEDLHARNQFDRWELRGRELLLYWRGLRAGETRTVRLDLLARIPGTTAGPASYVRLYYDAGRSQAPPLRVTVR